MLELGKFSKKLHTNIASNINKSQINKIYVYGKDIIHTFNKIRTQKRGKILNSVKDVKNLLKTRLVTKDI